MSAADADAGDAARDETENRQDNRRTCTGGERHINNRINNATAQLSKSRMSDLGRTFYISSFSVLMPRILNGRDHRPVGNRVPAMIF